MPLHVSSTCAHHWKFKIALHNLWYHHTYRWPSRAQVERDSSPSTCARDYMFRLSSLGFHQVISILYSFLAKNLRIDDSLVKSAETCSHFKYYNLII